MIKRRDGFYFIFYFYFLFLCKPPGNNKGERESDAKGHSLNWQT